MTLLSGTRLGPYEIQAAIGAGGMGEVYRARDARLQRDVAIKVLPSGLALDADRRTRFEREAHAIAALSHPNILSIFDFGIDGEVAYAVMELLDGRTVRNALEDGALAPRKAIEVGVQIARGLAAAHDKGIVHRDLKPENVFLVSDGRVKILDFGLARSAPPTSEGLTQTVAATDPGTVLGTVGYMAPEQVRGQPVDARADIFALGAVLFELLTGTRAFHRNTAADTMTAILREDPPMLMDSRRDLPQALDRIVRHCLEKNPAERFQSAHDVAFALDAMTGATVSSGAAMSAPATRTWVRPAAAAVGLITLGVAAGLGFVRATARHDSPITFQVKTWEQMWITNARFLPDGQTIIYSAALAGNTPQLFVQRKDSAVAQPVGPAATHLLSVSSRGELAVITNATAAHHRLFKGTLARMTIDGAARPWLEHVREGDWAPDGSTLAVISNETGRDRLEYPIGSVLREMTGYMSDPRVSPDGSRVAFFDHPIPADDRGSVKLTDRAGRTIDLAGPFSALEGLAWSGDGQSILFSASSSTGQLMVTYHVAVDGKQKPRELVPSADHMFVHDVARDGTLLVTREDNRMIVRVRLAAESAERDFPWLDWAWGGHLSKDGQYLLFSDEGATAGLNYVLSLRRTQEGSPIIRLGDGQAQGLSPDGKWALAQIPSTQQLVLYPLGPGETMKLPRGPVENYSRTRTTTAFFWTREGKSIFFCASEPSRPLRGYMQAVSGGLPVPVTADGVVFILPTPDGKTILEQTHADTWLIGEVGSSVVRSAKGLNAEDSPLAWSVDGRAVFVQAGSVLPAPIDRVDLATGLRVRVKELAPPDRAGLIAIQVHDWLDDGAAYTYSYQRELSRLFVAAGVRLAR